MTRERCISSSRNKYGGLRVVPGVSFQSHWQGTSGLLFRSWGHQMCRLPGRLPFGPQFGCGQSGNTGDLVPSGGHSGLSLKCLRIRVSISDDAPHLDTWMCSFIRSACTEVLLRVRDLPLSQTDKNVRSRSWGEGCYSHLDKEMGSGGASK